MRLGKQALFDFQKPFALVPVQLVTSQVSAEAVRLYALLSSSIVTSETFSFDKLSKEMHCTSAVARRAFLELQRDGWITTDAEYMTTDEQSGMFREKAHGETFPVSSRSCNTAFLEQLSLVDASQYPMASGQALLGGKGKANRQPKAVRNARRVYPDAFEQFWHAYPRHVGKAAACDVWQSLVEAGINPEQLLRAAKNYAAFCLSDGVESKFIKHASSFLNGDWMDFLEEKMATIDPLSEEVLEYYRVKFLEVFGSGPLIHESRDASLIGRMLQSYKVDDIKRIMDRWFEECQDRFVWRTGDIPSFAAVFNELLGRLKTNNPLLVRTPEDVEREERQRLEAALRKARAGVRVH